MCRGWWKDIYIVGGRTHDCVGGQWKDICCGWQDSSMCKGSVEGYTLWVVSSLVYTGLVIVNN